MVVVKLQHCRALKYCTKGVRAFIEKHGLSFVDFCLHGISEEQLVELCGSDILVDDAIELARRWEAQAQQQ